MPYPGKFAICVIILHYLCCNSVLRISLIYTHSSKQQCKKHQAWADMADAKRIIESKYSVERTYKFCHSLHIR